VNDWQQETRAWMSAEGDYMTVSEWLSKTHTKPSREARGLQFKNEKKPAPLGCGHGKPQWDKTKDANGHRVASERTFRASGYPRQSISFPLWSQRTTEQPQE